MKAALATALIVCGLSLMAAGPVLAQNAAGEPPASEPTTTRIGEMRKSLESGEAIVKAPLGGGAATGATAPETGNGTPADTRLLPKLVDPDILNEAGVKSMQSALKGYYDYRVKGFDHRARVFEWQLLSSRIIFVLVILIVVVGLYFSWLQFMAGLRENAGLEKMSTTVEATPAGGIKVSSPVLGVIILTLSLAFFYLYLLHVYPISEIF